MAQKDQSRTELPLQESIYHAVRSHQMRMNGEHKPGVVWIVSPPGAGKTEMIGQVAAQEGIGFLAYEPGLERPEKFGGIPELQQYSIPGKSSYIKVASPVYDDKGKQIMLDKDTPEMKEHFIPVGQELRTEWSVPQLICEIRELSRKCKNKGVMVLFDDWHLCTEDIQAIGFELFTHYSLNGHKVPNNVTFVLAGNDSTAAGARLQFSAVRNRCTVLHSYPDPEYWLHQYAIPNNIHNTLLGFFSDPSNYGYLHEEESTTEQFGSPRSWTFISHHFNNLEEIKGSLSKVKDKTLRAIIEGCVSKKAAQEFMMYHKVYSKIDVSKLFDQGKVEIPNDPMERFAYGAAVAHELYKRKCKDNQSKTKKKSKYTEHFSKAIRSLLKSNPEIAMKALIQVAMRVSDDKNKLPSGIGILTEMAGNGEIDSDILQKLPDVTSVMNVGNGV